MKKAENSLAQAVLRRSLNLAERIGDIPLLSYAFGNLGVVDVRTGNLVEAETELRHSITLAERTDDPISVSIWQTHLATALWEQGKLSEAKGALRQALTTGRIMHNTLSISSALVAAGSVRIAQAMAIDFDKEKTMHSHEENIRILKRARKTLQHALILEGIEVETRVEGQLALAHVSLLLGEAKSAFQQAQRTLEEARLSTLTWLVARAQQVLGRILAMQGQQEQAERYFEQALRTSLKCGMRLEYARTLQQYGNFLVQQDDKEEKLYAQGVVYLQEALQVFTECKAMLDVHTVGRVLVEHEQLKMK